MAPPTTHGIRAFKNGTLPKSWRFHKHLNTLRNVLVAEVVKRRGGVGPYDTAIIESAARHEGISQLMTKHLRDKIATLSLEQQSAICRDISRETDARDRCLEKLGLHRPEAGEIVDIYSRAVETAEAGRGESD